MIETHGSFYDYVQGSAVRPHLETVHLAILSNTHSLEKPVNVLKMLVSFCSVLCPHDPQASLMLRFTL